MERTEDLSSISPLTADRFQRTQTVLFRGSNSSEQPNGVELSRYLGNVSVRGTQDPMVRATLLYEGTRAVLELLEREDRRAQMTCNGGVVRMWLPGNIHTSADTTDVVSMGGPTVINHGPVGQQFNFQGGATFNFGSGGGFSVQGGPVTVVEQAPRKPDLVLTTNLEIPSKASLEMENQNGNVDIRDLQSSLRARVNVGDLSVLNHNGLMDLEVEQGTLDVNGSVGELTAQVNYGRRRSRINHEFLGRSGINLEYGKGGLVEIRNTRPLDVRARSEYGSLNNSYASTPGAQDRLTVKAAYTGLDIRGAR